MFVGDVRCATTGLGVSWKLSGGKAWSSGPTNVAKKRHVRRAIRRRARASAAESGWVGSVLRGTLIQRATAGDSGPQQQKGQRGGPGLGSPPRDGHRRGGGERDPAAHPTAEATQIQTEPGLRLRRGHPFQQIAVRDVHADERPHDRVAHQPGLVRQHRDREPELRAGQKDIPADRANVAALRDAAPAGKQAAEHRQERGHGDGRQDEGAPDRGRGARHHPRDHERQKGGRRRHGPAEVIQHLPAPDQRHPASQDPRKQLPIATRPSVLAGRRDAVVRGSALEQLDVGDETGAREHAFEEIVAQQRIVRHPSRQRRLERVHVVDALAGVRAFRPEVLVDVGHRRCVRVDAGRPRRETLEERALRVRAAAVSREVEAPRSPRRRVALRYRTAVD